MRQHARIVGQDDIKITVEIPNSVDPTKPHRVDLPDVRDFFDWQLGRKHVQDAFPYLDAGTREIFITGIGPEDFARMFPAEDDEPPLTDAIAQGQSVNVDDVEPPFLPDDEDTPILGTHVVRDRRSHDQMMRDMEHKNEYFRKDDPR